jgi:hexaprenyl-diphosphate synthase
MEDIRNFTASAAKLDLNGWATAPVLLAWEENPELGPLIQRQFKQTGDIEQVNKRKGY